MRRLVGSTTLIVAALTAVSCSDQFAPKSPPSNAELLEVQAPIIFVGAGDIASCTKDGDSQTALLVESILNANPSAWAFIAGDNAYDAGSTVDYRDCYGPTWGRFKTRTRPSLGNKEYDGIEGSKPAFDYFGDALWENSRPNGYYSFNLGDSWHIVVLNSNDDFVPTAVGSPQDNWLKADLALNHRPCLAAIWHHPRFFSSPDSTSSLTRGSVKPFWTRLYAAGADLVLNGHVHNYERLAPQNPDGILDRVKGIRQFIVGTGGKSTSALLKIHRNSEVRQNGTLGVMQLTLNASSYSWRFVPVAGKTFTDAGTNNCHGAVPPPANTPPTADFTPPSCIAGVACTFNSGGSDPDGTIQAREWDFGDPPGTPVTTASATTQHTYAAAAVHSVTLKVTDNGGASSAPVAKDVTVAANGPPTADFTPPSCIAGVVCTFTAGGSDPDGTIETREWDFGDPPGTPISTASATAQHTYAAAAVYPVTLKVTDNGGSSSAPAAYEVTVAPNALPTADFTPPSCIAGVACTFTAGGSDPDGTVETREWDFGDPTGTPITTAAATAQHTYAAAAVHSVTLKVTDNGGASSAPVAYDVTVAPNTPPTADFTPPSCIAGVACTFTAGDSDPDGTVETREWDFGDPAGTPITTASATAQHTYAAAAVHSVTLKVTDNGGVSSAPVANDVAVAANPPPLAAFTPPACTTGVACSFLDQSTDDGDIVTRNWDFGNPTGTVVSTPDPTLSHTYTTPGDYSVTLTVVDDVGATSDPAAQQTVRVSNAPPPPNAGPTAAFSPACTKLDCTFTDQSTDPDPGGFIQTWAWDFGDGSPVSTAQNPQHTYAAGGSKTVTLTVTDNGEEPSAAPASQTFTVAANVAPTADFTPPSCIGLTCTFTNGSSDSDGSFTSRWTFGDGGTSTSKNPSRTYAAGGTFSVTLTVTDNDLATGSATRTVTVTAPTTNAIPKALFGSVCTKLSCAFTDRSTDADGNGTIVKWSWSFGDGATSTTRHPTRVYKAGGSYKVKLTVTDNRGATGTITHTVAPKP